MFDELDELDVVLELELELLGRSKDQGTATCLPELELEEPLLPSEEELVPPELVPLEVPLLVLLGDELEPKELELLPGDELAPEELLPEELSERTAHSILPEPGLAIISLMVPSVSPEVDCT